MKRPAGLKWRHGHGKGLNQFFQLGSDHTTEFGDLSVGHPFRRHLATDFL